MPGEPLAATPLQSEWSVEGRHNMALRTVDMEPAVALAGMVAAMAEAGRYAGIGAWTGGRRIGRSARYFGTEAAQRAALAARVLGGARPPEVRRSRIGLFVAFVGAAAGGAAAALAARRAVTLLRRRDPGDGASVPDASPADPADASATGASS
jgi:hypothetical protein